MNDEANEIVFETPSGLKIILVMNDLTKLPVDCIVNAANQIMLGGGGVDGAIHRAAGPKLLDACRACPVVDNTNFRCLTGQAVLTKGPFDKRLVATDVIHTVGPIVKLDSSVPEVQGLLRNCIENCLHIALEQDYKAIAFPAISCGIYNGIGQEWTDMAAEINIQACLDIAEIERLKSDVVNLREIVFAFNERPLFLAWRNAAVNLIKSETKQKVHAQPKTASKK